jgi:hypothetical protein
MSKFILLKGTLPANHIPHMLGRVVVNQQNPLDDFVPHAEGGFEKGLNPDDIISNISDEAVKSEDLEMLKNRATGAEIRGKLSDILDAHISRKTTNNFEVSARVVVRKSMIQIRHKFERLMRDERYKTQVEELYNFHKDKKLALVTGVLISRELRYTVDQAKQKGAGLAAYFPVGQWLGVPAKSLDVGAKAEYSSVKAEAVGAVIDDEVIFALRYDDDIVYQYFEKLERQKHKHLLQKSKHSQQNLSEFPVYFGSNKDDDSEREPNSALPSEPGSDDEDEIVIDQPSAHEATYEVDRSSEGQPAPIEFF